ncbi:enoyl-CoA hydratase-related protein [Hoyosella subflava]|uniref:Enoyl-CoA hydratase n=1 Tax=Hoyosella subflava (strain DSM 45089 / JCM 17490 / NBRC 109087 / DQS3-9A1) TaxID=443218 RepID=F6EL86_HOYSD|nr:enoyl-CoA hydratase-related protein [Hoyosella subflava]AEF39178.1 Enoyl-CoA hydratase [Hoyosella subflava DQS3-9A1]
MSQSVSNYEAIDYRVSDHVATVMLNRPQAGNGYTITMANELESALSRADADPDVRVVVLAGAGKNFCVGADLSGGGFDVTGSDETFDDTWCEPAGRCSMQIFRMNKPVIAAINGAAVGAGSTIILSADYRLAAEDARFGFVFSKRGIYPEGASAWFLPRLVGLGRAMDWMISGRVFGATEALESGLVTSLHSPGELLDAAYELAHTLIATTAPVSVAVIRQMLYHCASMPTPEDVQRLDSRLIASLPASADAKEGVESFLERRAPEFPGAVPADIPPWLPWVD